MKLSTTIKPIIAALFLTITLTSCIKDKDYEPIEIAGLSLINAVPSSEFLDVYADNNRTTGTIDFGFGTKVDYLNAYAGVRNITVTKKNITAPLYAQTVTLENQAPYSLFVIDQLSSVKLLLIKDDLTVPSSGKAKVRFVHLSPDATAISLAVEGSANLFSDKVFKDYTAFEEITAGEHVNFQIKNSTGGVMTTLADVKIEPGKIYTIYAKGMTTASSDAMRFGAAIFTHK